MQLLPEPPISMGTTRQRLHGAQITGGTHSVQRNVQWSTVKERASQRDTAMIKGKTPFGKCGLGPRMTRLSQSFCFT